MRTASARSKQASPKGTNLALTRGPSFGIETNHSVWKTIGGLRDAIVPHLSMRFENVPENLRDPSVFPSAIPEREACQTTSPSPQASRRGNAQAEHTSAITPKGTRADISGPDCPQTRSQDPFRPDETKPEKAPLRIHSFRPTTSARGYSTP